MGETDNMQKSANWDIRNSIEVRNTKVLKCLVRDGAVKSTAFQYNSLDELNELAAIKNVDGNALSNIHKNGNVNIILTSVKEHISESGGGKTVEGYAAEIAALKKKIKVINEQLDNLKAKEIHLGINELNNILRSKLKSLKKEYEKELEQLKQKRDTIIAEQSGKINQGTGKTTQSSQETHNYRIVTLPDKVTGDINGKSKVLYPNDNWGLAGGGDYPDGLQKTKDGRYKVAVAPKILVPDYPDNGKIWADDFAGINRNIDVVLKNKSTDEELIINCYVKDIKAHSYNKYVVDENEVSFNIESGLIQTGIAYPNSANKLKFAPNNIDGSVIEFAGHSTGDFDPDNYKLVEIRVYK